MFFIKKSKAKKHSSFVNIQHLFEAFYNIMKNNINIYKSKYN